MALSGVWTVGLILTKMRENGKALSLAIPQARRDTAVFTPTTIRKLNSIRRKKRFFSGGRDNHLLEKYNNNCKESDAAGNAIKRVDKPGNIGNTNFSQIKSYLQLNIGLKSMIPCITYSVVI